MIICFIDYSRIHYSVGVGYQFEFGNFLLEPEAALFFSSANKFEVEEQINFNTFTLVGPATYEIDFNKYGGRLSLAIGFLITPNIELNLRPGFLIGELETEIVRETSGFMTTGVTDNHTVVFSLGWN